MKKRTFLKTTGVVLSGSMMTPIISCQNKEEQAAVDPEPLRNWAGNLEYSTNNFALPENADQIAKEISSANKLKILGTRHSFNKVADSEHKLVSLTKLQEMILNEEEQTVTVSAGVRYGELAQYLEERGYALHNLASLPHISVAGACSTATHGSGDSNGNLATVVEALEFVSANGSAHSLSRTSDPEKFAGAVVALGGIGAITKVTLKVQPTFQVTQNIFLDLPMQSVVDHFDEITSSGYSVSFFTDWQGDRVNQVWVKRKIGEEYRPLQTEFFGAKAADRNVHPIIEISAESCTEQMGVPGPWYNRLPHFKLDFTPSAGEELQAEYFVPRLHAVEAIQAVASISDQIGPVLMITEIRTVAADDLWMSPAYGQPIVAIHFTLKPDWEGVQKLLPQIEAKLAPFEGRPHWGKLFTMDPKVLQSRYERLDDFKMLLQEYDPDGKFRNAFMEKNLYS